jgi:hypothetical protein
MPLVHTSKFSKLEHVTLRVCICLHPIGIYKHTYHA